MTSPRRFEQDLPALLADLYLAATPDYRDDLVRQVARVRQRPAWTFSERWLPMDLATKALPGAPRAPWRIVGVLALLAALIAAMLAFYAGAERRQLAPAFGPAANGSIVFVEKGDIYTADPVTGKATPVIVGAEIDSKPVWSPDGVRFAFERKVTGSAGAGLLFVADGDGRGLTQITPEPLRRLRDWSFSPDGSSIVTYVAGNPGNRRPTEVVDRSTSMSVRRSMTCHRSTALMGPRSCSSRATPVRSIATSRRWMSRVARSGRSSADQSVRTSIRPPGRRTARTSRTRRTT